MNFTRHDDASAIGTSLLLPISATGRKIQELFGKFPGARQTRAKYSDDLIVKHEPTGELFTIYMCYGVWRIGGHSNKCTAIGELIELINPRKYKGATGRSLAVLRDEERREFEASCANS